MATLPVLPDKFQVKTEHLVNLIFLFAKHEENMLAFGEAIGIEDIFESSLYTNDWEDIVLDILGFKQETKEEEDFSRDYWREKLWDMKPDKAAIRSFLFNELQWGAGQ